MKKILFFAVVAILLVSCNSPEKNGKRLAEMYNKCESEFLEKSAHLEADFLADFTSKNYQSREAAINDFKATRSECYREYQDARNEADRYQAEQQAKYAGNLKSYAVFTQSYQASRVVQNIPDAEDDAIPQNIWNSVNTIVPPQPSAEKIQKDLVGREVGEGYENGYFSSYWRWKIEEGEISDFSIIKSEKVSDSYIYHTKMHLNGHSHSFDAKIDITYKLFDNQPDWTIDFVQSAGLDIVKTGKYDRCISKEKGSGWLFSDDIFLKNNSDVTLLVGGTGLNCLGKWEKFSCTIEPNENHNSGYRDVDIHFIERQ